MFPGDDIARLLPERLRSFADDLKRYPEGYPKWLYGTLFDEIYQGDIIKSMKVIGTDEDGDAVYREGPALVMSHTCDCQPGQSEYILIAPVFSLQERIDSSELERDRLDNHLRDLRANRLAELFFIPGRDGLPDSFVDFSQICPVASTYFHSPPLALRGNRLASLSQKGHYFLLMKIAYHLCRPDPKDSAREA
jgi:hypothetical protein